jgi:hypothetical protein
MTYGPEATGPEGKWDDLHPPGEKDLKQLIESWYKQQNVPAGRYYALIVDVSNPITGYHVVNHPAP